MACLRQFQRPGCGIKIEFSDASLGEDLAEFLRGLCFEVVRADEQTLEARFRDRIPTQQLKQTYGKARTPFARRSV